MSESKSKKAMKLILKIIGIILLLALLILGGFIIFILLGKEKTINQTISTVSLETIPDGTYSGSYSGFRWSNTVAVTITDHQITDVAITKPQVFMTDETAEKLIHEMISTQQNTVDAVSGATADSKAFMKAVENALVSASAGSATD